MNNTFSTEKSVISAIVAMGENRAIGKNNQLLWHLPADLKHFKAMTTGHTIIMGRKTFDSIGQPLPQRTNIVLTRDPLFSEAGCQKAASLQEAIKWATQKEKNNSSSSIIFIIGGADIYQQALPFLQRIYLTLVHCSVEGDVFFPELNMREWQETAREDHAADENNKYAYSFLQLERK